MPSFTVIRDVGESLKVFIQSAVSELAAPDAVVFDSPAELAPAASPKLSVFLYRIMRETHLRNVGPAPISVTEMGYPPLHLDLMYLMTPFSTNLETEFIILEKLLQAFYDRPVLRGADLQGNLAADGNEELKVVPDQFNLDEINKLWTAFPNKAYRLGLGYMVSPVRIPSSRVEPIRRVVTAATSYSEQEPVG